MTGISKFPTENALFVFEHSKIEGCPPVNYFSRFLGQKIKNCPPSKLFLFTSMCYGPLLSKTYLLSLTSLHQPPQILIHALNFSYPWNAKKIRIRLQNTSYFSKFSFIFHLKYHHTKDINLKFQSNWSNRLDVVSNFMYCSCL